MTWPMVRLGDITTEMRSGFACGEEDANGIAQLRMNNITKDGRLDWSKIRRVPQNKYKDSLLLKNGDIVFNATNSPELVGKTGVFSSLQEPVTFSNHFIRVRLNEMMAVPAFVTRWIQSQFEARIFERMCRQWVNQASVTRDQLAALEIPLPPLDEQRRIAAILDQADALRRQRRATLEKIDNLESSFFNECFFSSERFGTIKFGDILSAPLRNGVSPSTNGHMAINVLTLSAITGSKFDPVQSKVGKFMSEIPSIQRISMQDFLICRGNGNKSLVGRGYFPTIDMPDTVFPDTVIAGRIDHDKIRPSFLENLWKHPITRRQIEGKARTTNGTYKINQSMLEDIDLINPSDELQAKFDAVIQISKAQRIACEHSSRYLDTLFASLQQRAFRGAL